MINLKQNNIFIEDDLKNPQYIMSKIFTSFFTLDNMDDVILNITKRYTILHNKIFILEIEGKEEFIATYNVDSFNISDTIMPNTILLHRKKETNTLYSINSLNLLIRELNMGKLDSHYPINWSEYKNSILLVNDGKLCIYPTKIHKIINL